MTDIQEAQDKLLEICPDNEFPDIPIKWEYGDIIVPLENAIAHGWCGCTEPPGPTYYDWGIWNPTVLEARKGPAASSSETICGTYYYTFSGAWYPEVDNNPTWTIINAKRVIINNQQTIYLDTAQAIWVIEDEITVLESAISLLNSQILSLESTRDTACVIPASAACIAALAALALKEAELAVKEAELAVKEAELAVKIGVRDAARVAWDGAAIASWAAWGSLELRYPTDVHPLRDLFPEMSEPWGDFFEDTRSWDRGKWYYYYRIDAGTQRTITGRFSPGGHPYYSGSVSYVWFLNLTCKQTTTVTTCDCDCFAWQISPTHCCGGSTVEPNCCSGITCDFTWDWVFGVAQNIWSSCAPSNDYYRDCSNMSSYTLNFKVEHSTEYTR